MERIKFQYRIKKQTELVIFPGWLPFIPSWLVRTAGIIGAVFCVLTALAAGLKIYNRTSGGEVKHYKTKKFISGMTDKEDIIAAFNRHDFEYLDCRACRPRYPHRG